MATKFVFYSSWTLRIPRYASVFQIIESFKKEVALSIITLTEESRGFKATKLQEEKNKQDING